ncbi:MAG: DUF4350 domain-containing protein [Cyanobacteria bacterium J06559_3]
MTAASPPSFSALPPNRGLRIVIVAVVVMLALMFFLAPATGQKTSGSTFNRAPEGYLDWYRYMEDQGAPVQRWKRPLQVLLENDTPEPQTLLRVYPSMVDPRRVEFNWWIEDWLEAGNDLVFLGLAGPVTEADFTTRQDSSYGSVLLETRRRHFIVPDNEQPLSSKEQQPLRRERPVLTDDYGAAVWQRQMQGAEGSAYFVVTPHLAANAYMDEPGNYALLADLVSRSGGTIWIDEYLHGYTDPPEPVEDAGGSEEAIGGGWIRYLANTPVKIAAIQLVVLVGIFLLAQNQRLGNLSRLQTPQVDNSKAYIEALAGVLHKANSTRFLVDMITKAERSVLQRSLGFNQETVEDAELGTAWTQQTRQSAEVLDPLLSPPRQVRRKSDEALSQWLIKLRQIRQTPIR